MPKEESQFLIACMLYISEGKINSTKYSLNIPFRLRQENKATVSKGRRFPPKCTRGKLEDCWPTKLLITGKIPLTLSTMALNDSWKEQMCDSQSLLLRFLTYCLKETPQGCPELLRFQVLLWKIMTVPHLPVGNTCSQNLLLAGGRSSNLSWAFSPPKTHSQHQVSSH